jgi:hypothetical protein
MARVLFLAAILTIAGIIFPAGAAGVTVTTGAFRARVRKNRYA